MVKGTANGSKGTGFVLKSGHVITNEHVIRGNSSSEIFLNSSTGDEIPIVNSIVDNERDLAILEPKSKISGGLVLGDDSVISVGEMVSTWGFPLGYDGPAPLLSVGFLAGFKDYSISSGVMKHLVVNGAFNPGNSGGPLSLSNNNEVIGIVVSKHVPLTQFHRNALEVLAQNQSGVAFTATDATGNSRTFVESQIVAELLRYFHGLTQVMIGEAISVDTLKDFLNDNKISY